MELHSPLIGEATERTAGWGVAAALHGPCFLVLSELTRSPPLLPAAYSFVSYGTVLVRIRVERNARLAQITNRARGLTFHRRQAQFLPTEVDLDPRGFLQQDARLENDLKTAPLINRTLFSA